MTPDMNPQTRDPLAATTRLTLPRPHRLLVALLLAAGVLLQIPAAAAAVKEAGNYQVTASTEISCQYDYSTHDYLLKTWTYAYAKEKLYTDAQVTYYAKISTAVGSGLPVATENRQHGPFVGGAGVSDAEPVERHVQYGTTATVYAYAEVYWTGNGTRILDVSEQQAITCNQAPPPPPCGSDLTPLDGWFEDDWTYQTLRQVGRPAACFHVTQVGKPFGLPNPADTVL